MVLHLKGLCFTRHGQYFRYHFNNGLWRLGLNFCISSLNFTESNSNFHWIEIELNLNCHWNELKFHLNFIEFHRISFEFHWIWSNLIEFGCWILQQWACHAITVTNNVISFSRLKLNVLAFDSSKKLFVYILLTSHFIKAMSCSNMGLEIFFC